MTAVHEVINPTTEVVVATIPSISLEETDAAIARAKAAYKSWRNTAPGDRARLLRRLGALLEEHNEELAQLEVLNAGHTIGNARWEAGNIANVFNYYAGAPERLL